MAMRQQTAAVLQLLRGTLHNIWSAFRVANCLALQALVLAPVKIRPISYRNRLWSSCTTQRHPHFNLEVR